MPSPSPRPGSARGLLLVLGLVGALALPTPALAQEQAADAEVAPPPAVPAEPDPEAVRRAAEERLEQERRERATREEQRTVALTERLRGARADLAGSERALLGALAERNRVQGNLVVATFDAEDAATRVQESRARVRAAEDDRRAAERQLVDRREALADQIGLAYRSGSSSSSGQMVAVDALMQTSSPRDFAAGITYLDSVLTGGLGRVDETEQAVTSAIEAEQTARDARRRALEEREAADAAVTEAAVLVPPREARFESAVAAHGALGAGLTTIAAAERAATEAGEEHPHRRTNVELTEELRTSALAATDLVASVRAGAARIAAGSEGVRPWRELACPVDGPTTFVNDWGFPRTGGRSHEGTDIFAERGTPIVAMADGLVRRVSRVNAGLGGLTVTYEVDGYRIYNAHLDEVSEGLEPGVAVSAGEVLGTVGTTGNARGTPPHNHLGISRSDGSPVNPYPILRRSCS